MDTKSGKISVTTENIFPVIKQWLYEDKDIFVRELISNCADAIAKRKRLVELGEAKAPEEDYQIRVVYDDDNKTIAFEDNGIGMTAEEVEKYINSIAFSGAVDFVTKYNEESTDKSGIIGHFGLGFYSSFMVADEVTIETLSCNEGAEPVKWRSEEGMDYEISAGERTVAGTTVTIKLSDDAIEQFDTATLRMTIRKYCYFAPADLYFVDVKSDRLHEEAEAKRKAEAEAKGEEYDEDPVSYVPVNNKSPLWLKKPSDCTDDEYKQFYHSVFNDSDDPLFWIHLNMDYPFTLQGILYFPKTDNVYQSLEGRIKIYNHQIFVADNIEEIIPDFLFLLQGCLDCSDLPLNVSRSALQQDSYVKKLSGHIVKKVSDKLNELFKNSREDFEKYWSDISVFVKYGQMRDEKFYEKVKDISLYKTSDGKYKTSSELLEGDKKTIRYTTDPTAQAAYVSMSRNEGYDVVVMDEEIDNNYMSFYEMKNRDIRFSRVDATLSGTDSDAEDKEKYKTLFRKVLNNDKLNVSAMNMGADAMPALIRESEDSRRMKEMQEQYRRIMKAQGKEAEDMGDMFPDSSELVINTDSPIIVKIAALDSMGGNDEKVEKLSQHVYDQARLAHGSLDSEGLERFLRVNSEFINEIEK
ncbi:MAG: molecular chaperone HtpG [Clostridiales bacterium]|nr:molecular chaperone HtpG [Clostridiales bacterium]